jgi:hypothetical protein
MRLFAARLTHIKSRVKPRAETRRKEKAASNQIARLDADSHKAIIGLAGLELDEVGMMTCSFTQIGSPIAGSGQASARDPDEAVARRYCLREARPE